MKLIIKLGLFILLLSILTACSDIKEMVKRDLEIERRRAGKNIKIIKRGRL